MKNLFSLNDYGRVLKNLVALTTLRGFQFILPLITLPYLISTIGLENFGLVNFSISLSLYFGAIIQYGFSITATREIARHKDDHLKICQIYSSTLSASILLAIVCAILFIPITFFIRTFNQHITLHLSTLLFITLQSLTPFWLFQGIERMKYITLLSLGCSAMFLAGLYVFVKTEGDYLRVPLIHAVSAGITFMIAVILIRKQFDIQFQLPTTRQLKATYKDGHHAFITQLAPNLYNNSATFLLGLFSSYNTVGVFTAATKVIDAACSLAYILSNAFFPFLARSLNKHDTFQRIMMITGSLLTLTTYAAADQISALLFSSAQTEIAIQIQHLSICIFLLFAIMTYGNNYLMLAQKENSARNISIFTSLIFFCFAIIFIPRWGISGAVTTLIGARATIATAQFFLYLKKRIPNNSEAK